MNLIKWDQATCGGCQIQLSDKGFNMQSRLKKASPTEVVVQWKCPNCDTKNETLYSYSGDVDKEK